MKRMLLGTALFLGALLGATLGFGGGVPNIPSTPTFNEPSQIVSTLNAFINQLNGNPAGSGGYAVQPGGVVSIGSNCAVSGASPGPLTCTGARGVATFTAATVAGNANLSVSITDSVITTASSCNAWIQAQPTAGAGAVVASITPTANTLTIVLTNATATTTGSVTLPIGFSCVN
jgi:hypothetical protein